EVVEGGVVAYLDAHFDGLVGEDLVELRAGDAVHGGQVGALDGGAVDVADEVAVDVVHGAPGLRGEALVDARLGAADHVERAQRVDGLDDADAVDRRVQVVVALDEGHIEALLLEGGRGGEAADSAADDE